MKKNLFFTLFLAFTLSLFTVTAFADGTVPNEDCYTKDLTTDVFFDYIPETPGSASLYSENTDFQQYLTDALCNFEELIDITSYGISASNDEIIDEALFNISMTRPDLYYVSGYQVFKGSGMSIVIKPVYTTTDKEEVASVTEQLEERANRILANIDDSMTDVQKLLIIHDRLILESKYDDTNTMRTAKDLLLNGSATGSGYNRAFYYIAKEAGITGGFVSSEIGTWNAFYIDGAWYHVNIWLDEYLPDVYAVVSHKHFLKSNEWVRTNNSECNFTPLENDSTKYDNMFWNDVDSPIVIVSGHMFYIEGNEAFGSISVYNTYNGEISQIYKFRTLWYTSPEKKSYWLATYSGLASDGIRLYFNTPDSIMSCKLDGSDVKVEFTPELDNTSIYGCFEVQDPYMLSGNSFGIGYGTGPMSKFATMPALEPFVVYYDLPIYPGCEAYKFRPASVYPISIFEKDGKTYCSYNRDLTGYTVFVVNKDGKKTTSIDIVHADSHTFEIDITSENYEILVLNENLFPLTTKFISSSAS